jgi:DNA-binding NarL/FixJ family response regulator
MRSEELVVSIMAIYNGLSLFSPSILEKLLSSPDSSDDENESDEYRELKSRLKKREYEILKLLAKEYTNQQIADALYISEPTVRNYISSIYAKVGTNDRLKVMSMGKKTHERKESGR